MIFTKMKINIFKNLNNKFMKKQITILLTIFFIFFITISFSVVKAHDNVINVYSYEVCNVSDQIYKSNILWEFFKKFAEVIIMFVKFVNENLTGILGIIFLCIIFCSFCYLIRNYRHNRKILKKYKRENNGNDKKYTAKFCEEDCVFNCTNKKNIKKIVIDKKDVENKVIEKKYITEIISNSGDKILDRDDKIYLVNENEKCYHHIVDGYTFHKLGYSKPNQYKKGCFSKKDKEFKKEIKIYNLISDINNIKNLKF